MARRGVRQSFDHLEAVRLLRLNPQMPMRVLAERFSVTKAAISLAYRRFYGTEQPRRTTALTKKRDRSQDIPELPHVRRVWQEAKKQGLEVRRAINWYLPAKATLLINGRTVRCRQCKKARRFSKQGISSYYAFSLRAVDANSFYACVTPSAIFIIPGSVFEQHNAIYIPADGNRHWKPELILHQPWTNFQEAWFLLT